MMVIGGRTNLVGEDVALEIYDTESSEWYKFKSLQRFRHSVWAVDSNVFIHGGFEHETPNIPIDAIAKIDAQLLFANHPNLAQKIKPSESKKSGGDKSSNKDSIKKNQSNIYNIAQEQEFKLANQAHIAMSLHSQN